MNIETSGKSSRFKLLKTYNAITSNTLREELDRRKIPLDLASRYLQQTLVLDRRNQGKYMAFAYANVVDSLEIIIPFPTTGTSFRGSIYTSAFTLVDGKEANHAQIFSSMWDFLTWLTMNDDTEPRVTTYILNGGRSFNDASIHLKEAADLRTVVLFPDNNESGKNLEKLIEERLAHTQIRYASQSYLYQENKDLSSYWINSSEAPQLWPVDRLLK